MTDQVDQFVQTAEALVTAASPEPLDPNAPLVPFRTDLKLTRMQEQRMIEHAFARHKALESELGRDVTSHPQWWNQGSAISSHLAAQGIQPADTHLGKRCRYDATFYNDVSWRPWTIGGDNIFKSSNLVVPLSRRITRQMIARVKNKLFGSPLWFGVKPAPVPEYDAINDAARSAKIERFARFKLKEAESAESLGRAVSRALVLGECAVKTTYTVRDQVYNVEARVLHDVNGAPVLDAEGKYITPDDQFGDAEDGTGRRVLLRDQMTEEPLAPIWQAIPMKRSQVIFEGPKSEPIYFKDFLCPLTAPDVQLADCIIHCYDKPVMEFVDLLVKRGAATDSEEDRTATAQKIVAVVRAMADNTATPKAASTENIRPNENPTLAPTVQTAGPVAEFCEFYMWYDANGDGIAENIMLICEKKSKAPVFYDHVANVTVDGLRPIEIVRINPVEGRWYGQGIMELFDSYQTITDLLVNRWNFSQSRSGRVDFWNPAGTLEGELNQALMMNWGGTYTKKPGMKKEDILETVYLTDVKFEQIQAMIQFFMQLAMNESGVTNANDAQSAGLDSAELATGIMDIRESGDELFKPIITDLISPVNRILNREVEVLLVNMNPVELFTYLEGDVEGIDQLTAEEVRGLRFKTQIELSTLENNPKLQANSQAIALVREFYGLPPEAQVNTQGFYKTMLRQLVPECDPDTIIRPLVQTPVVAPAGAPGEAAPAEGPKGGEPPKPGVGDTTGTTKFPAQLTQRYQPQPKAA